MASLENLYERPYKTPTTWRLLEDRVSMGPTLLKFMEQKIEKAQEKLKAAEDRQKSYVDRRRTPLEFNVLDHVFLKVIHFRNIVKKYKNSKLDPIEEEPNRT